MSEKFSKFLRTPRKHGCQGFKTVGVKLDKTRSKALAVVGDLSIAAATRIFIAIAATGLSVLGFYSFWEKGMSY